jgi:hypothetical protein
MKKLCVLFLHHLDDALTRYHAEMISKRNPRTTLVPLTFRAGLQNAICPVLSPTRLNEWRNSDFLIYNWFHSKHYVAAKRYIIVEYDTLCVASFEDFYAAVWDEPVAAAGLVDFDREPEWHWFCEIKDQSLYRNRLAGMRPISGIFLSHPALAAMSRLALDPIYVPLYCECRIGTLARTAGYKPVQIRTDAANFISWEPRHPSGPGIWHSVKSRFEIGHLQPDVRSTS